MNIKISFSAVLRNGSKYTFESTYPVQDLAVSEEEWTSLTESAKEFAVKKFMADELEYEWEEI